MPRAVSMPESGKLFVEEKVVPGRGVACAQANKMALAAAA